MSGSDKIDPNQIIRPHVVMYGGPQPPEDIWPGPLPDPRQPFVPPIYPTGPGGAGKTTTRENIVLVIPSTDTPAARPEAIRGLASLLPVLKDALRRRAESLTADEATAMVWLEGLAAGVAAAEEQK